MIKDFTPRLYQETILNSCVSKNVLVVLPTGLGKTAIAMLLAVQRLKQYPSAKILFIAPTKPLVEQHRSTFQKHLGLEDEKLIVFTGAIRPEKRAELWKSAKIVFSTPQGLENDIISERIKLDEVSLIIFDEAHRAVGDYAYNFVAKQYNKLANFPRILALTASPGSSMEKINEVCKNLFIEDVEIRTYEDPDVKQYVQPVSISWIEVDLPPQFLQVKRFIDGCLRSKLLEIKHLGFLSRTELTKKELLQFQGLLQARIAQGDKEPNIWKAVSLATEVLKIYHASELLETQGAEPLLQYMERLVHESEKTKTKAVQNLVRDVNFKSALVLAKKLVESKVEHPKLTELKKLVAQEFERDKNSKLMIFNNFRDNASKLVEELNAIGGVRACLFIGQAKRTNTNGLSQKNQKEMLEKFRNNDFNVLVATSIGEEGLDIPKVDSVIFYEPIPSAIRHIQRRGRTGRSSEGKVIILVTRDTRDNFYRWSAVHKERRMYKILGEMKRKFVSSVPKNKTVNDFIHEDIKIIADYREKGSGIIKELVDMGVKMNLEKLETADYVLSPRCAVEYKTVKDFVDSIVDGRLLEQTKSLKETFARPLIVVEGTDDVFSQRNIHPNAIRGMIATITVSYGIPIIHTKNFRETAALLAIVAKREQEEVKREPQLHPKKPLSLSELQEYIVASLPSVGPNLAKDLLRNFKTIKNVINAPEEELKKIDGVGEKIAKNIRDAVDSEYK